MPRSSSTSIMLKGKTEPERAHALLGGVAMAATPAYQELVRRQAEFLAQYRSAGFAEALELIAELPGRRGCRSAGTRDTTRSCVRALTA